jgi:NAD(P)-dependent dehydrogenase (short-subunit alcohol dehydrogenase family)
MGRLGEPEQIAAASPYLAIDNASFVAASALYVDGEFFSR